MPRYVTAHDLELFAVNTGEFYPVHKKLAGQPIEEWMKHVIGPVMRHYCATIEPVQIDTPTAEAVATALAEYYLRHAHEMATIENAKQPQPILRTPNVIPLPYEKLAYAAALVRSALGQQHVLLTGNPADGFTVIGPFPDAQTAIDHLDGSDFEGWALTLYPPND